jgi:hypothetical protein
MRTISHTYSHGDIELVCELEYSPGERETDIDPAWPAQAVLITAKIQGVDVVPLLNDEIIGNIEESAVWSMQS